MRNAFVKTLTSLAKKDKNIYLLTGDLGYSVFEDFSCRFPKRFINCGVAEQNMMGVAAGLALSGKKPYVYSITPFVTLRCLEQIKDDVCYQNLNVKIVGFGSGLTYGSLGATHLAIEDIAVLRGLPNMTILSPADALEAEALMLEAFKIKTPVYLRLGRGGQPVYQKRPNLKIGVPSVIEKGRDGVIIATGVQVSFCLGAIRTLRLKGKQFKLISLHTLKPINKKALLSELTGIKNVFTVEEHSAIGGLGGAVAETLAESQWQGNFKIIGFPDEYPKTIGSPEYLRHKYSLDEEKITKKILNEITKLS